ncbi:type II CAAX prenyl endopeptidase Rce1 family protein [Tranquillimonas rosea]|uniref:CPBP family glutamic-type intramembrane protease n=1 Tax=Tranquillimonas rosea TaxID=641238 RepID=UPI003BAA6E2F
MADTRGTAAQARAGRKAQLWVEFALLFVAAPLAMAVVLPPDALFPGLFAVTVLGIALLHLTPGFGWDELVQGAGRISPLLVLGWSVATAATGYGVVQATAPEAFGRLVTGNPRLMLMIAVLYPVLSALPQELLFRPLFFRRYGLLLPGGAWAQVTLNAALFSMAHLMYWSWVVAAMTFFGSLAFGYSYRIRRNFPEALVLHAISGIIVFALGLGVFFYSGNVTRPF